MHSQTKADPRLDFVVAVEPHQQNCTGSNNLDIGGMVTHCGATNSLQFKTLSSGIDLEERRNDVAGDASIVCMAVCFEPGTAVPAATVTET